MYRLVTGWYLSEITATRILEKVKASYPKARVIQVSKNCYSVLIDTFEYFSNANLERKYALEKNIACGVEILESTLEI